MSVSDLPHSAMPLFHKGQGVARAVHRDVLPDVKALGGGIRQQRDGLAICCRRKGLVKRRVLDVSHLSDAALGQRR